MYLYLDLILLLNFCIDFLLLWMTAQCRKLVVKKGRLACAAGLGSLFVLCLFIPALASFYNFWGKLMVSMLMIWIAFGYGHFQKYVSTFLMFYFVSFITGGGMLAVHYLLQSNHQLVEGVMVTHSAGFGDKVAWWFVLLGFPVMYLFSSTRWRQLETTKVRLNHLVSVSIWINGHQISCTGLIDTGNQLYEPVTNTPVLVIETRLLKSILPPSLYARFSQLEDDLLWNKGGLEQVLSQHDEWCSLLRFVPYRGVGQQMRLMLALKPELIEIRNDQESYRSRKVLLGLQQEVLSSGGEYQAIVHPTLLETANSIDNFQSRSEVNHVHQI